MTWMYTETMMRGVKASLRLIYQRSRYRVDLHTDALERLAPGGR